MHHHPEELPHKGNVVELLEHSNSTYAAFLVLLGGCRSPLFGEVVPRSSPVGRCSSPSTFRAAALLPLQREAWLNCLHHITQTNDLIQMSNKYCASSEGRKAEPRKWRRGESTTTRKRRANNTTERSGRNSSTTRKEGAEGNTTQEGWCCFFSSSSCDVVQYVLLSWSLSLS